MNSSPGFDEAYRRARKLHDEGRLREAELAYRQLAIPYAHREEVLANLANLYVQSGRRKEAVATLAALTELAPNDLSYYVRLAAVLEELGETEAAIEHYRRLLKRRPRLAAAHFNLALLYKRSRRFADALAAYEQAARLGIRDVQEVYSNMGVLYSEMRRAADARAMYERALEIEANYVPALFNLAGLCEEEGLRDRATELYRRILTIDAAHWDSLSRLAHVAPIANADDEIVAALKDGIERAKDPLAREGLYFGLGKVLDDLGRYEEAFAAYAAGNALGKLRLPVYDRVATERAFGELIDFFARGRIQALATGSRASPIFICGMLRSGSTLVEQILAAHPAVTPGGELDLLPWLIGRRLMPYPQHVENASRNELESFGEEYLSSLHELFPGAEHPTDKTPDNFVHLGLIKLLFPASRIVYTKRNALDNCVSVFFQQLGGRLSYTADLEDIAHFYRQHERLMAHWNSALGPNIFTVDYDELVRSPEQVIRRLLQFLGLPWHESCLSFHRAEGLVKTASVWQVREELNARGSGRWRNYESLLGESFLGSLSSSLPRPP